MNNVSLLQSSLHQFNHRLRQLANENMDIRDYLIQSSEIRLMKRKVKTEIQKGKFEQCFMDFTETRIHQVENNTSSQQHLEDNELHFSLQCKRVMQLMNSGVHLTRKSAMIDYNILSVERRFLDITTAYAKKGITCPYVSEWVTNEAGKRIYKEYFKKD